MPPPDIHYAMILLYASEPSRHDREHPMSLPAREKKKKKKKTQRYSKERCHASATALAALVLCAAAMRQRFHR